MSKSYEVGGKSVIRNTVLNLLGSLLPLLVGVITIPYVIRGLGVDRFGVLSLGWIVLSYFNMFDFGLGRATIKFVAEALGRNQVDRLPSLVWSSLAAQFLLGLAGGAVLTSLVPIVVNHVLEIPPALRPESREVFYVLGGAIPFGICSMCLRGVLEAGQRFDLVNAVKVSLNSLVFLLPVVGLKVGFHLPGIGLLLLVAQFVGACTYLVLCLRTYPVLRRGFSPQTSTVLPLFAYGGWVTGYNLIIPIATYIDRFFIGMFLSVGMVPYYTVPYDTVSRLQVLPQSLSSSLLPAFSSLDAQHTDEVGTLCARGVKYLLMVMGPLALALVLFAGDILRLWLGLDFELKSTQVFQILVIGAFLNALSWPPTTVLLGTGRPDLITKVYAALVVFHAALSCYLIVNMGILGAAIAVVIRGALQLISFFVASWRSISLTLSSFGRTGLFRVGVTSGVLVGALSLLILSRIQSALTHLAVMVALTSVFLLTMFRYVLNGDDLADMHHGFFQVIKRLRP
jgi:O-antigen/teichoic acid export membrane protein